MIFVKKFQHFIFNTHFTIVIGFQALTWFKNANSNLRGKNASSRLSRNPVDMQKDAKVLVTTRAQKKKQEQPHVHVEIDVHIDDIGILRVGGRLQHAPLTYNEMHPIILPSDVYDVYATPRLGRINKWGLCQLYVLRRHLPSITLELTTPGSFELPSTRGRG